MVNDSFWLQTELAEMSDQQWESLCDGCGRCCLLKLEDEDTGDVYFTNVSCHLLNTDTCRCKDYTNRKFLVPQCLQVRQMQPDEYQWLPDSCAYRLLSEGKPLPHWHPLLSGDQQTVSAAGVSVEGWSVSEDYIHPEQLQEHIIELPAIIEE